MLAAYHGHAPLVQLLMQHGANPNTLNDRGQSPLAGAVFKNEAEVVEVGQRRDLSVLTINLTEPEPTRRCLQAGQIRTMARPALWKP